MWLDGVRYEGEKLRPGLNLKGNIWATEEEDMECTFSLRVANIVDTGNGIRIPMK